MSDDFHIVGKPGLDDPIWDYVLTTRLQPYIPYIREWWKHVDEVEMHETGISEYECGMPGIYIRYTRTAIRSPIKGVQVFPFIPAGRLQITGIQGGSTKMITRCCIGNRFTIDEFTVICKNNLPSVFNAAQILAFVPTDYLEDVDMKLGKWFYLSPSEQHSLMLDIVEDTLKDKLLLKL